MSLYQKRIAAGLCGSCGTAFVNGSLCESCRAKAKQKAAEKRAKLKSAGKCIQCQVPIGSGVRCEACKGKQRDRQADRSAGWKRAGLCVSCGQPPKDGCSLCQSCIDRRSEVSSRNYRRRKAAGTCYYCDSPRVGDLTVCEHHREKYAEYRANNKLESLEAYGGAVCASCGETDVEVLEIDHIDGGGRQHRVAEKLEGGQVFYLWLKRNGYPPGFRVLCSNCNQKAHLKRLRM